ncbi:MAG: M1 family metallopeptidase [Deltaproteobacteria bacterium]|nr:M1 family metallopeptidase [Deltaproteobacteria bacterium]
MRSFPPWPVLVALLALWALPARADPPDAAADTGRDAGPGAPRDAPAPDRPTATVGGDAGPPGVTDLGAAALAQDAPAEAGGAPAVQPVTPPEPARAATEPLPDPAPGRPREVVRYVLRARLDAERHAVHGEGTILWRNSARAPTRELWFQLYMNGFEHDRTLFLRSSGGEHRGNVRGRAGRITLETLRLDDAELLATARYGTLPEDRTELQVTLPREVAPGETIALRVRFVTTLPEVFARTGYHERFHMVAQWFPKLAVYTDEGRWAHFPFHANTEFFADFGGYDVTLEVPRGWVVGATGQPSGPAERAGALDRHRYLARDVHDFAWATWDRFRELRSTVNDLDVRVLYPPGELPSAERAVRSLERVIPVYAERFGAYPYPNLTVLFPPYGAEGAGGMEYPTFITTEGRWWLPEGVHFTEYVTAHEYAHQYFYGLFASNENAWPFLDEGMAEYATCIGLEAQYGRRGNVVDLLGGSLECYPWEAAGAGLLRYPTAIAQGAPAFPTSGSYGAHVYSRTATVLRTAEGLLGRSVTRAALARYSDRARFRHPTPEDLLEAFEDAAGPAFVRDFLRPALFTRARVNYAVQVAESHRVRAGRYVGRVVVARDGELQVPVDIALERADGRSESFRWDGLGERWERAWDAPVALRAVRVDPHDRLPLDDRRLDNARRADSDEGGQAPGSVALVTRVAYWLALALQAVGP